MKIAIIIICIALWLVSCTDKANERFVAPTITAGDTIVIETIHTDWPPVNLADTNVFQNTGTGKQYNNTGGGTQVITNN